MPRITSFTSRGLTVAVKLGVAADTSLRAPATLNTFGPSNGVYIPGATVIGTTNTQPDQTTDRNFVITGKNSIRGTVSTYTPNGTMTLFYVDPASMQSQGYGFNAFLSASAFGNIPADYANGAPIRDLINTNGVVTIEVSWTGMTAPFIINLTS